MPPQAFEPQFMKVGVLTAALQELTPRERRDADPDLAIEEWLAFAAELDADCIQLAAALHPSRSDVPPEAMLDPVANTLDLREPLDSLSGQASALCKPSTRPASEIADIGYFDNMLHADPGIRAQQEARLHAARLRRRGGCSVCPAVCGFVGRNQLDLLDRSRIWTTSNQILRSAALEGGPKARGLELSRRAMPDAGLDDGRCVPQQHRLHAGCLDRPAPRSAIGTAWGTSCACTTTRRTAVLMGQDTRSHLPVPEG